MSCLSCVAAVGQSLYLAALSHNGHKSGLFSFVATLPQSGSVFSANHESESGHSVAVSGRLKKFRQIYFSFPSRVIFGCLGFAVFAAERLGGRRETFFEV